MMKRRTGLTIIAFLLVVGASAPSQTADDAKRAEELRERFLRTVQPTADQEVQLDRIWLTHQQALANWRRENDQKLQAAQNLQLEALKTDDRDTLQAVRGELLALLESRRRLRQSMMNQMEEVLTEQQFAKARKLFRSSLTGAETLRVMQQLQLSDIQKTEMKRILDKAALASRKEENPADREAIMDDALETIEQTVLSVPQRTALQRRIEQDRQQKRRQEMLGKMEFTEEQKAKIRAILAEARQKAEHAKTSPEKQAVLAEAHRVIRRDVWTEKQREQFTLAQIERQCRQLRTLGLSEAQIAQAEKILLDAHVKAQAAPRDEEKRQILRDAHEKIRTQLLQTNQREHPNPR
ncbi:MAG: hypothetical protein JXA11_15180 [Phycisphaerae bacterium]|nr:hypothetical protein [Phycisphaerae bacterium]